MSGDVVGRRQAVPPSTSPSTTSVTDLDTAFAQLMDGAPQDFYDQAGILDRITAELVDGAGRFGNKVRNAGEVWDGIGWNGYQANVDDLHNFLTRWIQALSEPSYGSLLRRLGDVLASGQKRIQDLKSQRDQEVVGDPHQGTLSKSRYDYLAQQIMQDVQRSYVQIGQRFAYLPDYTSQGNRNFSPGDPAPPEVTSTSTVWTGTGARLGHVHAVAVPGGFAVGPLHPGHGTPSSMVSGVVLGRTHGPAAVSGGGRVADSPARVSADEKFGAAVFVPAGGRVLGAARSHAPSAERGTGAKPTREGQRAHSAEAPLKSFSVRNGVVHGMSGNGVGERKRAGHHGPASPQAGHAESAKAKAAAGHHGAHHAGHPKHHPETTSCEAAATGHDAALQSVSTSGSPGKAGHAEAPHPSSATGGGSGGGSGGQHVSASGFAGGTADSFEANVASLPPSGPATQSVASGRNHPADGTDPVGGGTASASSGTSASANEVGQGAATTEPDDTGLSVSSENPTVTSGSADTSAAAADVVPSEIADAVSGAPNSGTPFPVVPASQTSTPDGEVTGGPTAQPPETAGGAPMGGPMMGGMGMGGMGMAGQLNAAERQRTALFLADGANWGPHPGLPAALGRPEPPPEPDPVPGQAPEPDAAVSRQNPPGGQKNG